MSSVYTETWRECEEYVERPTTTEVVEQDDIDEVVIVIEYGDDNGDFDYDANV